MRIQTHRQHSHPHFNAKANNHTGGVRFVSNTKYLIPVVLSGFVLVGCDQQKATIENNKEATKDAIDHQKKAVDVAAKDATKQTDANAAVEKARIEAGKVKAQAQLDADKKKADAQATLENAKVDAEKKQTSQRRRWCVGNSEGLPISRRDDCRVVPDFFRGPVEICGTVEGVGRPARKSNLSGRDPPDEAVHRRPLDEN